MPCMCWYDPPEESKKFIKDKCIEIVEELKKLEKIGDPQGLSIKQVTQLLNHLYDPSSCEQAYKD